MKVTTSKTNGRWVAAGAVILLIAIVYAVQPVKPLSQNVKKSASDERHAPHFMAWFSPDLASSEPATASPKPLSEVDPRVAQSLALRESDYEGHPAYNKAMHLMACQNYFATKENSSATLAELKKQGESTPELQSLMLLTATQEAQCKMVNPSEFPAIDSLMQTAAESGDKGAQAYLLDRDFKNLEASFAQLRYTDDAQAEEAALKSKAQTYLTQALELAQSGHPLAASTASDIMASEDYGLKNLAASVKWRIVSLQAKGSPFSEYSDIFDIYPEYGKLSKQERKEVIAQAAALFASCCGALPSPSAQ